MLSDRFRDERVRLGLGVNELAAICGVTRHAIGKIERGASSPGGDLLAAFAGAGADVNFVLTGERRPGLCDPTTFGMCEVALVNAYMAQFPDRPRPTNVRSGPVVQIYNRVIVSPLANQDLPAAVREGAEQMLSSLHDPLDPQHLEWNLFRPSPEPAKAGVTVTGDGNTVSGRDTIKIGSKG